MPVFVLTDLGYGDAGKGSITDALCHLWDVHTVVRTGGHHAGHNVVLACGRSHVFSQFGSGTLAGADTFLSKGMVVQPLALLKEAEVLKSFGFHCPTSLVTIDSRALVTTPYHRAISRLKELALASRQGTVGLGVGQTVLMGESHPDLTIRAGDLSNPRLLADKLEGIRLFGLENTREATADLLSSSSLAADEAVTLLSPDLVAYLVKLYTAFASQVRIVNDGDDHLLGLLRQGVIVFEPSQGVLLDRWHGFHPFTTKVGASGSEALNLLTGLGYPGEVVHFGITRAYSTRHGPGPFVSEDEVLTSSLPDTANHFDEWQRNFRVGWLDLIALKYALDCCGTPLAFNGLAVTCLDRLPRESKVCTSYHYGGNAHGTYLDRFFCHSGGQISSILVHPNTRNQAQLDYQQELGRLLFECRSDLDDTTPATIIPLLEERFDLPVSIVSSGPTWTDKIFWPYKR